ncbi:hypothetical protein B9Z55_022681 [Caenorhabditis nigoni]|uniref:Uncharacterized protein n=1 Tax=Caenorhabditis nigoni TaxID=1611254 RepID=A0A2G5SL95_9PELO|nr:hypothetical protein B9Z55_022681 [Caenorhabditis nigoni]
MDVNQVLNAPQHSTLNALEAINEQLTQTILAQAAPSAVVPNPVPILEMFRGINPSEHGLLSIPTALPGPRGSLTLGTSQLMINMELSRMQEQLFSNMKALEAAPAPVSHSSSAESSSSNYDSHGSLTLGNEPISGLDPNFQKALLASTTLCSFPGISPHVAMSDCIVPTYAQKIEEQFKKRIRDEQQNRKRVREHSGSEAVNAEGQDVGARTELASSEVPPPKLQVQGGTENEIQVIAHHRCPPKPVTTSSTTSLAIPISAATPASVIVSTSSNRQASSIASVSTNVQGTSWQQKVSQSMQQPGLLEQRAIIIAAAAAQPKPPAPQLRAPQSQIFVLAGAKTESSGQQGFDTEMFDCGYMQEAEIVTEDHIPQNIGQKIHSVMNKTLATPGIFGSNQRVHLTITNSLEIKNGRTTTKVEFGKIAVVYLYGAAHVLGIGYYTNNTKERLHLTILKINSNTERNTIAEDLLKCCAHQYVGNPTAFNLIIL